MMVTIIIMRILTKFYILAMFVIGNDDDKGGDNNDDC